MAHVQKRARRDRNGKKVTLWVARYRGPDGKERSRTFPRQTAAQSFLTGEEGKKLRGEWTDPSFGRETLGSFWNRWLEKAEAAGKPTERTLIAYNEIWRLYIAPTLERRSLVSITRADVEEIVSRAGQRSAWRETDTLKVIRMLLGRAVAEDRIGRNPASGVQVTRVEQEEAWVLDPTEVERLAEAVPERWRAFVLLAAYSSLRWSELVALKIHRLELPRRRIRVEEKITEHGRLIRGAPKTKRSRRTVAIPEFVALELAEHIRRYPPGQDGLIFTAQEGGPVRRSHFGTLWRRGRRDAGLDGFPFKNLRHTGASLAIAAGANPLLVAARLGHTSTRMVEKHYVSLFEGLDREIGDQLGVMREHRERESQRLRPTATGADAGQMRDGNGKKVVELPRRNLKKNA